MDGWIAVFICGWVCSFDQDGGLRPSGFSARSHLVSCNGFVLSAHVRPVFTEPEVGVTTF